MIRKLLCLCLSALLLVSLMGCGKQEPAAEPVPETTAAPTTEPTEPVTEPTTEPTTVPTEPPVILHSGLREDGSFDEGTWFIGDSMTCILVTDYLMVNDLIGDATYTGKFGAHITAFFDGTRMLRKAVNRHVFRPEHENMTYDEVAAVLGEQATAIYMMWGTNYTWNAYADAYIEIVDYLLETCPNATVYLQTIPWGYPELIKFEIVNEWVNEAYAHYQELGEERVQLIDTYTAIGKNTDSGTIHLDYTGNENWYNAIVAHARENEIPQ